MNASAMDINVSQTLLLLKNRFQAAIHVLWRRFVGIQRDILSFFLIFQLFDRTMIELNNHKKVMSDILSRSIHNYSYFEILFKSSLSIAHHCW